MGGKKLFGMEVPLGNVFMVKAGALKRKHESMLVSRPNGTLYAESKGDDLAGAIAAALDEFAEVHGHEPDQGCTVIEVIGVTAAWVVVVMEIKE